jgi:7,8-dihydropterin-6-yl-methyl-4-(beta-D-ribofuranosyl)aminobenzene 5'-phosphate synthase
MGAEMKLTVLIDNNTLIDRYFLGEPGVSYLIEDEGKKILFDVGYSDAFITNARKLSIDLLDVDFVVLSHGHLDHTWGLVPLIRLHTEGKLESLNVKRPKLVTHPLTLSSRKYDDLGEIGSLLSEDKLSEHFGLQLSREPVYLTERLVFLGEIERTNDFEAKNPIGKILEGGVEKDDFLLDDSALAYKSPQGLVIITGCSHAGICNIVEYAKKVCEDDKVVDIVGGFHLLDPSAKQLQGTAAYLKSLRLGSVHACHCTDLNSKITLSKVVDLKEVGVGLVLEY